ncbi:hypothetical protein HN011_003196 [Eciton burchellii]|nr:hypothetical protein HN011_003196 [Eciton burchellii]
MESSHPRVSLCVQQRLASSRLASPRLASPRRRRLTVKIPPYSRKNKSTFVSTVCDLVPSTGVSTSLPADGWRNRMRSHTATSPPARFANIHQGYWVDPQSCVLCLCANVNPVFLAIQDKSLITREPYSTLMEMSNKHVPRLIGSRKHRFSLKSNSQPATRRASAFIHILVFHRVSISTEGNEMQIESGIVDKNSNETKIEQSHTDLNETSVKRS